MTAWAATPTNPAPRTSQATTPPASRTTTAAAVSERCAANMRIYLSIFGRKMILEKFAANTRNPPS
jgi:hypothetical protein